MKRKEALRVCSLGQPTSEERSTFISRAGKEKGEGVGGRRVPWGKVRGQGLVPDARG